MNSDINTELHVKGERVLSEENKKENDHPFIIYGDSRGKDHC